MKKNLKRMLAFVSAVIMVLTMLPVGVLAETEEVGTPAEQLLEKPAAEVAEQQPVQPQEESTPAPATEAPKSEAPASEEPSESPEVPETPSSTYSVIYKDGKGGAIFEDQVYEGLMAGDNTPDFLVNGKKADPQWANHIFTGWSPKVEAKVNGDVVYTAQWSPVYPKSVTIVDDCLTIHCTGDHTHEDFTAKAWNATTTGGRKPVYNEERGVWTVEASINPNSLYSVYLQKTSPWGKRKHDAANFMLINLVWSEEQAKWLPDTEGNQPIVVNYVCYDKPAVPKALTSYKSTSFIKLIDTDNPRGKTYLPQWKRVDIDHPNSYAFGEVTQKENGDFSCILTITDLSSYIGYYNEKYQGTGIPFVLDTEKTAQPITVEFTYKKNDVEYKQDGSGWITPQITNVYIYRRYAVTYTDGVGGEAFADQVYNVKPDDATPEFNGEPSRVGYEFLGWTPEVAATVTGNATYTATWKKLPVITYEDGVNGEVFATQSYFAKVGEATPKFQGTPTRTNWKFIGWEPAVAETVTGDATYVAQWEKDTKNKPASVKLSDKELKSMKFRVYFGGTEIANGFQMDSCSPSKVTAKDVPYEFGPVEGNDVDGYTATMTFHFKSGDKLELAGRKVYNTDRHFTALPYWKDWNGNWVYDFTEAYPADQTVTLYWVRTFNKIANKWTGSWKLKSTFDNSYVGLHAVSNYVKLLLMLPRTVTYTDGVEGAAFADQVYTVRNGSDTPAYEGSLRRKGYVFQGWEPEVAEKVYADVTYTATWAEGFTVTYSDGAEGKAFETQEYDVIKDGPTPAFQGTPARANYVFKGWLPEVAETVTKDVNYVAQWEVAEPAVPSGSNSAKALFKFRCTTVSEHEDQTYNWFGSYVKYKGDKSYDADRGVWVATAQITNVQTLLAVGVHCPDKVWGHKHYHTDENGKTVRTADIKLVWNPDVSGENASGNATNGLWLPDGTQYVDVWCYTAPAAPVAAKISGTLLWVRDTDNVKNYTKYTGKQLLDGTYTISKVTKDENGAFWAELTITNLDAYVQAFNTNYNAGGDAPSYIVDTEKTTATFTYKLKYTAKSGVIDYAQDGSGWTVDASTWADNREKLNGKELWVYRRYVVTYTDGVGGEAFADQVYNVKPDDATPEFNGEPSRVGYEFLGWTPEVAATVTGNATYTATWKKLPVITYEDGVNGEVFATQSYFAKVGEATPKFQGTPTRTNWKFIGWEPAVAETVTGDATYVAQWEKDTKNKPSKLTKTTVDKMQIRAYASGTEVLSTLKEMWSCSPSIHAKGVSYTIGAVEGNDVDGYTTTVTFHFVSGDKFEAAARNVFNTTKSWGAKYPEWNGDWTYDFTEERPADQVLNLTWVPSTTNPKKGSWKIPRTEPDRFGNMFESNLTSVVANYIKVNLALYRTVTYTDGVEGEEIFADQVYTVRNNTATPAFEGKPEREGYAFLGWQPAVADTVTANVTYVAQWAKLYTVTYTDGMDGKVFADQVFTVKEGEQTPAFDAPATWQGAEAWELYEFNGWTPELAEKVTENQTYTAQYTPGWNTCLVSYYMQELDGSYTLMKELSFNALYGAEVEADVEPIPEHFHLNAEKSVLKGTIMREGDGIPGGAALSVYYDRDVYTVTYEDGVKGKAFKAQGYEVMYGEKTPAFEGTPKREGFRFHGWKPQVAETVSGDVVYTATWYVPGTSDVPSTGDVNRVTRIASLLGMALMAAAGCAAAVGSKRASRKED